MDAMGMWECVGNGASVIGHYVSGDHLWGKGLVAIVIFKDEVGAPGVDCFVLVMMVWSPGDCLKEGHGAEWVIIPGDGGWETM